ncbi:DNA-binding transcription factor [Lithospermum erythrorhizon]|uniref:DNA-binding transcription factor n=1 Tax=Lithospermum erythrorhizon TaxID=34254 RepID=A0AAV3RHG9_LITER
MKNDVKVEGEERDLHAEEVLEDLMRVDDDELMERQIYSLNEQETNFLCNDVVNVSSSIFYTDDSFPPLPDFPCISSSSSSSSLPPPSNPLATVSAISTVSTAPTATPSCSCSSSSSSAASWAALKSDSEAYHNRNLPSGVVVNNINIPPIQGSVSSTSSMGLFSASGNGIPGLSVMEDIGCLDLDIEDGDDIWDPSSIFLNENNISQQEEEQNMFVPEEHHHQREEENNNCDDNSNGFDFLQGNSELSGIFLDWLKQNKDFISAEDMRNITLKRSTIESAMRRLGNSNEGKKHLLKLILQWVEDCKLQKKKLDSENSLPSYNHQQDQFQDFVQNPNPDPNACFSHSPWLIADNGPPSAFAPESGGGFVSPPQGTFFQPGMGYLGNPYACNSYIPQHAEFQQLQSSAEHCWQQPPPLPAQLVMPLPPQYVPFSPDNNSGLSSPVTHPQVPMYANSGGQYHPYQGFDGNVEAMVRMGSSATKEARKKRMARQRRFSTHHFRHHNPSTNHHENIQNQMQANEQQHVIRMNNNDDLNCSSTAAVATTAAPVGNWVYWPPSTAVASASMSNVTMVPGGSPPQIVPNIDLTHVQRSVQTTMDRRQGWRTEKNLKFLLQKVLKQSDVGNLGRIVLPKKEAELHLPELESRDGIGIALEDIGTSRVWNMRYRFWPNNKSRMYLLENTGEFVRTNGLQEGDFIVLYSDNKCGKYMIRGVKVRQQGLQLEGKKPIKRNIRKIAPAFNGTPHCPAITQAVK